MSYYFSMGFKPAESFGNAMIYAHDVVRVIAKPENIKWMLDDNAFYSLAKWFDMDKPQSQTFEQLLHKATELWVSSMLNFRFVYFHEQKLLGISCPRDCLPEDVHGMFDGFVGFQNSTDQDYERGEWAGIKLFEEIFDRYMEMPFDQLLASNPSFKDWFDDGDERTEDELKYTRKSAAYCRIFELLQLDDWLYGKDNPTFTRFTLNAFETSEEQLIPTIYEKNKIRKRDTQNV